MKTTNLGLSIGIDEAGVGCIAGPLVVAAAAFKEENLSDRFRDSKRMSLKQRSEVFSLILNASEFCVIVISSSSLINEVGGVWRVWDMSVKEAYRKCAGLGDIIIDGTRKVAGVNARYIPKADDKFKAVSAASILAKSFQTRIMERMHGYYPEFGFNEHHGYATGKHCSAISKHGIINHHRITTKIIMELADRPDYVSKFCSDPSIFIIKIERGK